MQEEIRPLGSRVLVRVMEQVPAARGGLVIPEDAAGKAAARRGRRRR